ncbi:MAG: hypothetical protein ACYTAN_02405 [Planctomycetota bacterium]|jgi:hypothetical protein
MRQVAVLGILVLAVVWLCGCESMRTSEQQQQEMGVADNLVIADLPVPNGFKMDNSRSHFTVIPGTDTRVVFATYTGRGDSLRLMEFFRQNMTISGWKLKSESSHFGPYIMKFEKGGELAEIKIRAKRFSTEFTIALDPKTD